MPSSKQHISATWGLEFGLSKTHMNVLDLLIDGHKSILMSIILRERHNTLNKETLELFGDAAKKIGTKSLPHDSYRTAPSIFLKIMDWAYSKFGDGGVEYCFFHIVFDEYYEWWKQYKNKFKTFSSFSSGTSPFSSKFQKNKITEYRKIFSKTEQLVLKYYSKHLGEWNALKKMLSDDKVWRMRLGI